MTRGVDKARKAIKKRKQEREQSTLQASRPQRHTIMPMTEEEKHGFGMPLHEVNQSWESKKHIGKTSPSRLIQAVFSIALFGIAAVLLQVNGHPFEQQKTWLAQQLQEEFPFAKVHQWYVANLGEPLALAPDGTMPAIEGADEKVLPVMGQVVEAFNDNGTGIKISPEEKSMVTALDQGIVIFAGNDAQTKQTVKIQHADGTSTTYGSLSTIDVHLYQAIQPNQRIGSFTPTEENEDVFFSIEKDNQFIDPFQVIPVDDLP